MNKPTNNCNETPLLRAGTNVINTPVETTKQSPCGEFVLRYNVGNIHEIKQIWNVTANG